MKHLSVVTKIGIILESLDIGQVLICDNRKEWEEKRYGRCMIWAMDEWMDQCRGKLVIYILLVGLRVAGVEKGL